VLIWFTTTAGAAVVVTPVPAVVFPVVVVTSFVFTSLSLPTVPIFTFGLTPALRDMVICVSFLSRFEGLFVNTNLITIVHVVLTPGGVDIS
jgi:hypothetical protein